MSMWEPPYFSSNVSPTDCGPNVTCPPPHSRVWGSCGTCPGAGGPVLSPLLPLGQEPRAGSSSWGSRYPTAKPASEVPGLHERLWEKEALPLLPQPREGGRGQPLFKKTCTPPNVSFSLPPQPSPIGEVGSNGAGGWAGRQRTESGKQLSGAPIFSYALNSEPEVLWNGDKNTIYLVGLSWGLSEWNGKCLGQCRAHSVCYRSVRIIFLLTGVLATFPDYWGIISCSAWPPTCCAKNHLKYKAQCSIRSQPNCWYLLSLISTNVSAKEMADVTKGQTASLRDGSNSVVFTLPTF